jgi:hypothetical protein
MSVTKKKRPKVGSVVEIPLPTGKYAYGRLYEDAGIGIYRKISVRPGNPPVGSRDFLFVVGVYEDVLTSGKWPVVGEDSFPSGEDTWPPPSCIIDPISGEYSIYRHGKITPALPEECQGLEIAAVWGANHIVDRILNGGESRSLRDSTIDAPKRKSTIQ